MGCPTLSWHGGHDVSRRGQLEALKRPFSNLVEAIDDQVSKRILISESRELYDAWENLKLRVAGTPIGLRLRARGDQREVSSIPPLMRCLPLSVGAVCVAFFESIGEPTELILRIACAHREPNSVVESLPVVERAAPGEQRLEFSSLKVRWGARLFEFTKTTPDPIPGVVHRLPTDDNDIEFLFQLSNHRAIEFNATLFGY
jgi:hypothetical protein